MSKTEELYQFIEAHAQARDLSNTLLALPAAKELLAGMVRHSFDFDRDGRLQLTYYEHCMAAAKILIDLDPPLEPEEEDILLASTLCHDMLGHVTFQAHGTELMTIYHLDRRVYEIVRTITRPHPLLNEDKPAFYRGIQENKLALLLALADRANLIEQLYSLSIEEAMNYVQEIRTYALPMCTYALEHYPDVQMSVSVLMSKIRCLIDVTDIISKRYQDRERAYQNEILSLTEDNARLRGMIRQMQE